MTEVIREYGTKVNFPKPGQTGIMSLPRSFSTIDKMNLNAEHLVRRTTVGGAFEVMVNILRRWVKFLSKATLCWMLTILFLINNVPVVPIITAFLGAYYFGNYRIWYSRWKGRQGFAALVPVL